MSSSDPFDAAGALSPDVGAALGAGDAPAASARVRRVMLAIFGMLAYQGFTMAINGIGAPWIAKSFSLDQSGIAALFACISVSSIGALILSRMVDRMGRRTMLLLSMAATPLCAMGAALSADIRLFAAFEILLYAFIGATFAGSFVMIAEELPIDQRARGQSLGGLAMTLGGGLCVVLMPILAAGGYSWRWLLVLSAAGIVLMPPVARIIPESRRWEHANASGATRRASFYDVFGPRYRRRAVPMLITALLGTIAGTAALSWNYFHAVTVVGLQPGVASLMMMAGGGLGMAGFPIGARAAERLGRVPTVVGFGLLVASGALIFYWGPPARFAYPALWLAFGYCWLSVAQNATQVGGNAAATELFPTAIRGTMFGWFSLTGAVAGVIANAAIWILAKPLGGLSNVVGYLSLLGMPSAIIFGLFIPESRGLSLEAAAHETLEGSGPKQAQHTSALD